MSNSEIIIKVKEILNRETLNVRLDLEKVCGLLKEEKKTYDWVGFYFRNGNKEELKLKAYVGEATDHTIIPFGKGICGQVAISNQNFLVPDVQAQDNYISCNIHVKSEIVIPLFIDEGNIGQIDIDSNTIDAFKEEDALLLEEVNRIVAEYLVNNKYLPVF